MHLPVPVQLFGWCPRSFSGGFVFKIDSSVLLSCGVKYSLLELLQTEVNLFLFQCSIGKLQ